MKTLRVLFLVLLALLLPLRGVVAGAMLCPEGGVPATHEPAALQAGHDLHQAVAEAHHHDPAGSNLHDEPPGSAGHASGCGICATVCSMTPLLSAMPTLERSMVIATVTFPVLSARAYPFQSGGQDRPPRSI